MNGIFAIFDTETDYANQFMEYMKRKEKSIKQIHVFTNYDSLKEYVKQNRIHILLINEKLSLEGLNRENITNICILTENNGSEGYEYPVIYKFQRTNTILEEVFSYYPKIRTKESKTGEGTGKNIISVFSLGCEEYRQLFALSAVNCLGRIKKTVSINLDGIPTLADTLCTDTGQGVSDLIYLLKQDSPNLNLKIKGMVCSRDNVDFIRGVSFGPDLYELTSEDIFKWLNEMEEGDYDTILFDTGCYFQGTLDIFRESRQVYILLKENEWYKKRYEDLKQQLVWAGYGEIIDKFTVVFVTEEIELRYKDVTGIMNRKEELISFSSPYLDM